MLYNINKNKNKNKNKNIIIFSSSVVERSTVNRLVLGSSPSWGV